MGFCVFCVFYFLCFLGGCLFVCFCSFLVLLLGWVVCFLFFCFLLGLLFLFVFRCLFRCCSGLKRFKEVNSVPTGALADDLITESPRSVIVDLTLINIFTSK